MISLIVITPVVAFYMLVDWDHMVAIIDDLIPPRHREDVRSLARDIDRALAGFVRGQSLVCLFLGVWYAVGLSAIGLNFGFLIGVIAGFLSFVPYVGSITAFVLSIIVAIVQGWPHVHLPIEAVAIVTTGLIMDGYVLSPRLVGASVGLHPVWIMFALLAFGALFGFTGLHRRRAGRGGARRASCAFLRGAIARSALYRDPIARTAHEPMAGATAIRAPGASCRSICRRRRASARRFSARRIESRGARDDRALAGLAGSRPALIGPPGAGKSHLCAIFARRGGRASSLRRRPADAGRRWPRRRRGPSCSTTWSASRTRRPCSIC